MTLQVPASTTVLVNGFTNSGEWPMRITVTPAGRDPIVWTGTGFQRNALVGQAEIPPLSDLTVSVALEYDPGGGFVSGDTVVIPFSALSLGGYVVGGNSGDGTSENPTYWNCMAYIYWSTGH